MVLGTTQPQPIPFYPEPLLALDISPCVETPNCKIAGIVFNINIDEGISFINSNNFMPIILPQIMLLYYNDIWYTAASPDIRLACDAIQELQRHKITNPKQEIITLLEQEIDQWCEIHQFR